MIIDKLVVGDLGANCYILGCEHTKEAAVIDPGGEGAKIAEKLSAHNLTTKYIVNTHGHVDHIGGNEYLKSVTEAVLAIHPEDAFVLTEPEKNLSQFTGGKCVVSPQADLFVHEGDTLNIGELSAIIIATPGHTQGGICLQINDNLFTGDTLFLEGIGRCDLPGGDYNQLIQSIESKLMAKKDKTIVHPGHGPSSTIGYERSNNPFLTR